MRAPEAETAAIVREVDINERVPGPLLQRFKSPEARLDLVVQQLVDDAVEGLLHNNAVARMNTNLVMVDIPESQADAHKHIMVIRHGQL